MSELGPRRALAALAALLIAAGGVGMTGCGDDSEGPAEDAGKKLDEAGRDAERELDEASKDGKKD